MLQLHTRVANRWDGEPIVLRVTSNLDRDVTGRLSEAFLLTSAVEQVPDGFSAYLIIGGRSASHWDKESRRPVLELPSTMSYLSEGDIIRLSPASGHLAVLYRRESRSNSMLLTENCNSYCTMCSQPPKVVADSYLVDAYLRAISLMDKATTELGITGGEPTLLGARLMEVIEACKTHLPHTALHILSNGRLFNYLSLCEELARVQHPDQMIGIPIYSDLAAEHDFVVQSRGAFDQTIRGIMNLERCGQRVEIRVVIHRDTFVRLAELARFIARNLPFVEHVALMALEPMGFGRTNYEYLWVDPIDYAPTLNKAVRVLLQHGLNVSLYNHQLCTIAPELWPLARKSISDWKNEYLTVCESCDLISECGGFFSSAANRHSRAISPVHRTKMLTSTTVDPSSNPAI